LVAQALVAEVAPIHFKHAWCDKGWFSFNILYSINCTVAAWNIDRPVAGVAGTFKCLLLV
jgi:hypothetical protein